MKSLRMTCGPLINIHWRNWVGSVYPVPISYHKHLHPPPQTRAGQTVFLDAQTFFWPPKLRRGCPILCGRENIANCRHLVSWSIPGRLCQADANHKPQIESAVLPVNVLVWRGSCLALCRLPFWVSAPARLSTQSVVIIRLIGTRSNPPRLKPPFLLPVAKVSRKKLWSRLKTRGRSFLYELKVKHVASFMFPSLWSVGGPVWLSWDDLLITIQYGPLEALSHIFIGKEEVTWSHSKSWCMIQFRIHLSQDHQGSSNLQVIYFFLPRNQMFLWCFCLLHQPALMSHHLHCWCIHNHWSKPPCGGHRQ